MSTSLTTICQKMVILVCHKCGHSWDYTGNSERATCPDCEVKVPVEEVTLPDLYERQKHLGQKLSGLLQRIPDDLDERLNEIEERISEVESQMDEDSDTSEFDFSDGND